jgi:dUTP pyrophosphatase
MSVLKLSIVRLPHADGLELPSYETHQAAGMDLRAAISDEAPIIISPGGRKLIPTGLVIELPQNHEGQIRPRSGLAFEHGITVLNSPGTIDADYRGEVQILLINHGNEPFEISRGMRIAQMIVAPVVQVQIVEVGDLSDTDRGAAGYGSTGTG